MIHAYDKKLIFKEFGLYEQRIGSNATAAAQGSPRAVVTDVLAYKNAEGVPFIPDGRFEFELIDVDGNVVGTTVNDAVGNVRFTGLTFTEPGVYVFNVRETTQSGDGWTVDENTYPVTVTVIDIGGGELFAYQDYYPIFVNTYTPQTVSATPATHKVVCGRTLSAGQYRFTITDENGQVVGTAQNDANGDIIFPSIEFSEPGTYTYYLEERLLPYSLQLSV